MTRRTFIRSGAIGLVGIPVLSSLDSTARLRSAIDDHRLARSDLDSIERSYARLAPGFDASPAGYPKLRRLEDQLGEATTAFGRTSKAVIEALDSAGLEGVIDDADLFAVARIEPEGSRRLVVIPMSRIAS